MLPVPKWFISFLSFWPTILSPEFVVEGTVYVFNYLLVMKEWALSCGLFTSPKQTPGLLPSSDSVQYGGRFSVPSNVDCIPLVV